MSCSRVSTVLHTPFLRSVGLRQFIISAHSRKDGGSEGDGGNNNPNEKASKSVADLMSALKGIKVDGISVKADAKKGLGFSAVAEFKKRKQLIQQQPPAESKNDEPTNMK